MADASADERASKGQASQAAPGQDISTATPADKTETLIGNAKAPLRPGQVVKLQHVKSGYTFPPSFKIGAPAEAEEGAEEDEGSRDLTFQVIAPLGDEKSDGGYRQHPRRDHDPKDLPHGPPPAGHRFLLALPGGVADWNGAHDSTYDKRATRFVPFYHSPHLGPKGAYSEEHAAAHEPIIVSLRGRLLVDEDYGAHEGPSAFHWRGGITGAPDEGRYLGVKGPNHVLVSNAGIGPDSRLRVTFVKADSQKPRHEPKVGGRLRHQRQQSG